MNVRDVMGGDGRLSNKTPNCFHVSDEPIVDTKSKKIVDYSTQFVTKYLVMNSFVWYTVVHLTF